MTNKRRVVSVVERVRQAFAGDRGKDVAAPFTVIPKAGTEHAEMSGAIRGVVDEIWRPGDTKRSALRIAEDVQARFVLRFPGEVALQPTHDGCADAAIITLIDATLIDAVSGWHVELAGAGGQSEIGDERNGDEQQE